MLKKFIINVITGIVLIVLLAEFVFSSNKNAYQDMAFVIGIVMFSGGLLTVTEATKVFSGIGYVFRRILTRKLDGVSYYEYLTSKEERRDRKLGYPLLFAGLLFIAISILIISGIINLPF